MSGFLRNTDGGNPLASISSSGRGDGKFEFLGGLESASSEWCVLIGDSSEICGGIIGSAGKFCAKLAGKCSVSSHTHKKFPDLEPGLFIRVGGTVKDELRLYPRLVLSNLNPELCNEILLKDFTSVQDVVQFFDQINTEDEDAKKHLKFDDIAVAHAEKKMRVNTKTPVKRAREHLLSRYDQLHGATLQGTVLTQDAEEVLNKVKIFNQFLASQVNDSQAIGAVNSEKLESLRLEIGSWPRQAQEASPLSLWVGLAELQDDIAGLTSRHEEAVEQANKRMRGSTNNEWRKAVQESATSLSTDIGHLRDNMRRALEAIEQQVASLKGMAWSEFQTVSNLCQANEVVGNHDVEIRSMKEQVGRMQKQVQQIVDGKQSGGALTAVTIGNFTFHSIQELNAWCESVFKKDPIPFGPFACPYGAYTRCLSSVDTSELSGLQIMDKRRSLAVSPDESLVLECFQHKLPKLFLGSGSADHITIYAHLPALATRDKWEDKHRLKGVRVTIRDNKESVRSRYSSLIAQRLSTYPEAQGIARELLSDTMDFIESINTFISDTDSNLVNAGFNREQSWELVTKLVHRIFAVDCNNVRAQVKEFLDPSQHRVMALGCLWGTFATHMVMREYVKHGIENHPSIAAEYVRFLVANSGLARLEAVEKRVLKLEDGMTAVVKRLDALKKVADSALTKATEAYSLAKNK
jgi:hypothetical protein